MSVAASGRPPILRIALSRDDLVMRAGVVLFALVLLVIVGLPLWSLLAKGFEDRDGKFVGLANYVSYFSTPALFDSALNSFHVAAVCTLIVVPLAFFYAYALTRTVLPARWLFQGISLIPIFAPSLLPGLALIYLFGNQGFFKGLLGGSIYGFDGIVIAQVFYCFPHATLILVTALATADARLYEAADALGASKLRVFFTVTLPGAKYGLISAALVVFTLVLTDFGIAKVIGGNFNVLATDVYKQVIGQQNFSMGAVVGMMLLAPAALAFLVDRLVQRKQVALLTARAVPLIPRPKFGRDLIFTAFCSLVSIGILGILGMAVWGSLIKYWPYNLSLTLGNYAFANFDAGGWSSYYHSLEMAAGAAIFGTTLMFVGAWLNEKTREFCRDARHRAVPRLPAHGGARPGAGAGLHLLLQRAQQSAELSLCHHGDPGDQHDGAFLYGGAPDGDDGPEADRSRVRIGLGLAQGPGMAHLCARDGADLPAGHSRHRHLPVRQCDDDRLVGDLPLRPRHQARLGGGGNIEESGATAVAAALCIVIVITSAAVKALHVLADRFLLGRLQAWRRR